jgi:hypothetical protein
MDRDQVNCLHYLYQGDPSKRLTPEVLFGLDSKPSLVWCSSDTVAPLTNSGILQEDGGAVSLPDWCLSFIDQVEDQLRRLPQPDYAFGYPFSAPIRKQGQPRPAFLAISYAPKFDPIKTCILEAARRSNFTCEVTGDLTGPGNIMDQVWQGIRSSDVVVADVTDSNANVMIEVGMAAALGKEVIVLGEEAMLPFDIRQWRKITYDRQQLPALQQSLMSAFGSVSARYPYEGREPRF